MVVSIIQWIKRSNVLKNDDEGVDILMSVAFQQDQDTEIISTEEEIDV